MRIYTEEKTIKPNHQNGFGNNKKQSTAKSNQLPTSISSSSSNCSSTSSIGLNNQNECSTMFEVHNGTSINRVNIPMVFNKNRPNISMYKFISSKGKQVTKESQNGFRSNQYFDTTNDYILKPPRYVTRNHNFYKKRISAIDKIQEELREMKLREDELRCQRVRGLSYPNLNSICDEDFNSDDQTIESSEENKDSFHSRCSSNPDLLNGPKDTLAIDISTTSEDSDCGLKIGGPRRKIPLIAIWEQKIQEENNDNNGENKNSNNGKNIVTN